MGGGTNNISDNISTNEEISVQDNNDNIIDEDIIPIDIKDIDWQMFCDGDEVKIKYKNNTDYIISHLYIDFFLKDGVDENAAIETILNNYNNVINSVDRYKEDTEGHQEYKEKIQNGILNKKIVSYKSNYLVKSNDELQMIRPLFLYGTDYIDAKIDNKVMDIIEPRTMYIYYVDSNNMEYKLIYDFKTKELIKDGNGEKFGVDWVDEYSNVMPKPELIITRIDKNRYGVMCEGVSEQEYNAYKEQCKTMGYNVDIEDNNKDRYKAKNKDGYTLSIEWGYNSGEMFILVKDNK